MVLYCIIRKTKYNRSFYVFVKHVLKGKTNNSFIQLFRYTFVGGFTFLVDFCVLFVLTEFFGIHYLLSAALGFISGLIINYILSVKWVFSNRTIKNRSLEILFFVFIGLIGLGMTELFLWIFTKILLIYYLLSKIITTIIVYFWNFFARKIILYN